MHTSVLVAMASKPLRTIVLLAACLGGCAHGLPPSAFEGSTPEMRLICAMGVSPDRKLATSTRPNARNVMPHQLCRLLAPGLDPHLVRAEGDGIGADLASDVGDHWHRWHFANVQHAAGMAHREQQQGVPEPIVIGALGRKHRKVVRGRVQWRTISRSSEDSASSPV